jgi:hypothetical protein
VIVTVGLKWIIEFVNVDWTLKVIVSAAVVWYKSYVSVGWLPVATTFSVPDHADPSVWTIELDD